MRWLLLAAALTPAPESVALPRNLAGNKLLKVFD
jgi:hypothetical protein